MEQTVLYMKELQEVEEDMIQAYLEKSRLGKEEAEIISQRALEAQKEFEALEQRRDKTRKINEKMREEIKKMEQAVASSSSFIKNLKGRDQQQAALNKAISNFWDTSDVPPEPAPTNIASYPSMESLDEERRQELTEAQYKYYNLKRAILVEKMTVANEIYLAHLQNYKQEDPKTRSQKYLIQFNELMDKLNREFEMVVAMLNLHFEKSLMTYPSLEYVMDIVQQEDLTDKNRELFQELMREIGIKNAIAQKVLRNRLAAVGNSEEEAEVNLLHKEYQKESFRLLRFCRKMIEKKDKEAGYIELEQPEVVPDVKSIMEKELDQKLRARVEPQQVDPIGSDTIPPYYSRKVSRYEPPISVQEKEKQEALEKVREITNGGSKGSKSEKPVEGDTDLSWDHEGLEPHPKPGEPKPPRDPKSPRTPKTETKEEQSSAKVCPKCKGNHDERDCTKFIFKKEKQGSISPQPIKSNPQVDKSETKVKEKWNPMERNNNVDKDTERWVEEQNAFFEKKREKQSGEIPARFDPKGPVTILQKRHNASVPMSGQMSQRLKDSKYTQSQPNNWMVGYEGTWYRKEFGAGYNPKGRKWPQGNGYGKRHGTKEKNGTGGSYRQNGTQSQTYYTTQELKKNGQYLPMNGTGDGQDGKRGVKAGMIRGNLEILSMTLKIRKMRKVIQKIPVN